MHPKQKIFARTLCAATAIVFCNFISLPAQQPGFHRFGKADGLPSDNIYDVILDRHGSLWFGTDLGVSRYDGNKFHNYTMADGLPDDEIFSLYLDKSDRIWFGSYNGVPGYYQNGTFYNPNNCSALRNVNNHNYISSICETPAGDIVIGSRDGNLHRINFRTHAELLLSEPVSSMAAIFYRKNEIMEISISNCEIISIQNGQLRYHTLSPIQYPVLGEIMVASAHSNGTLIMGYGHKLTVVDNNYRCTNYQHPQLLADHAFILKILDFRHHRTMVCTSSGAYMFYKSDFSDPTPTRFLPGVQVSGATEDNEGGLWFATKSGVYYAPEQSIRIADRSKYSTTTSVTSITPMSDKDILVGYEDGSIVLTSKNSRERFAFPNITKHAYSNKPNKIIPTINGKFWVSTDNCLQLGDTQTRTITPLLYGKGSDLSLGHDLSRICFCHSFGWSEYDDIDLLSVTKKDFPTLAANQSTFERCYATYYDYENSLWIASGNHLLKVSNKDTTDHPSIMKALGGRRITSIAGDHENLWIGTAGAGLIWIFQNKAMYMNYGLRNVPTHINKVSLIKDNLLGVATTSGFFVIEFSSFGHQFKWSTAIGYLDGLPSDFVSDFAIQDSLLFIATNKGYASMPIGFLTNRVIRPKVNISDFSVDGQPSNFQKSITIPYNHNRISITFSGVSFRSMGKFKYLYRLIGLDSTWHHTEARTVEYPFLQPGKYRFEVFAQNHQGNWSESAATFSFTVATPYWKTLWFSVVASILILLSIMGIFYIILTNEQRKAKLKQLLYDAEQRALIGQMNPHFIFNSLNSIQSYFMNHALDKANEFLSEFGELIRSTLNNSRKATVPLAEEISELRRYLSLEQLRMEHAFIFDIEIEPTVDIDAWKIPTMLIQPLIENAIWHGITPLKDRTGRIVLKISADEDKLQIELSDNGIGRVKSAEIRRLHRLERKSHAMNITQERISLINAGMTNPKIRMDTVDIYDGSGVALGTKILIIFEKENYSI